MLGAEFCGTSSPSPAVLAAPIEVTDSIVSLVPIVKALD